MITWFPYDFIHVRIGVILVIRLGRLSIVSTWIFPMEVKRVFNTHIKVASNDVEVISRARPSWTSFSVGYFPLQENDIRLCFKEKMKKKSMADCYLGNVSDHPYDFTNSD